MLLEKALGQSYLYIFWLFLIYFILLEKDKIDSNLPAYGSISHFDKFFD